MRLNLFSLVFFCPLSKKKKKVPQTVLYTASSFFKMVISSSIKCNISFNGDMRVKLLLLVRMYSACVVRIVQTQTSQTILLLFLCEEILLEEENIFFI